MLHWYWRYCWPFTASWCRSWVGCAALPELVASGRNAIYAVGALVLLASLLIWRALLTNEFQIEYIAGHSERALPTLFKISAHWGGQAGSLLFWTLIACGFSVAATWFFRRQAPSLKPWVNAVLLINIAFFLIVVLVRRQSVPAPLAHRDG